MSVKTLKAKSVTAPASYKFTDRRFQRGPGSYSYNLYATPANTGQTNSYRPRPLTFGDFGDHVDVSTWQSLISYSRQLYAQLGNLGGAVVQKNTYAVGNGWLPQFAGRNTAWGEMAEEWLVNVFYPVADVRGQPFDFQQCLFLDGVSLDVDGDAGMLLTRSESGFPQLQWVPAHRIGQRGGGYKYETVQDGDFAGARIVNGCILNNSGRVIGYRILGDTPDDDQDVTAQDFQLLYEPEWQTQFRGIPRIGRTLLDWFDIQDIDSYLKRTVKLHSTVGLLHYNETGKAPTALDIMTGKASGAVNQDVKIETLEGGEIRYFKAGTGGKVETLGSDTPSANTEAFIQRLERRGLLSVNWFYELLDPTRIGGASVRLIQDQARHNVAARQKTIRKRAYRAIIYALARGIKGGFLKGNNEPGMDWMRWDFTLPPQITVDEGYSRQADIDDLDRGLKTKASVCGKAGLWWEDVDEQRDREVRSLIKRAKAIAADEGIELQAALDLLQHRSANTPEIIAAAQPETTQAP